MTDKIIPVPKTVRKNLTGKTFGRLTVLGYVGKDERGNSFWLCRCACGNRVNTTTTNLLRTDGPRVSCGCQMRTSSLTHGMTGTPEYQAWRSMYQRCTNPNNPQYPLYGGRGIEVCPRWRESFQNFFDDMGPRPGGDYSIDRINTNGHYTPDNCHWATPSEQSNNTRVNRLITFKGETHTMVQWAKITGISKSGIKWRMDHGWSVEEALTIAPGKQNTWLHRDHAASKTK